ncbi:DUF5606 family protein [Flavihumibacter fluvii]|uniref:DUF5606 family protein n=1 Tax=Flavihumibacter fluvii TaxID=2838157 RepID=UPI001BDF4378|nr:DUF5606 domain-containing protein [Flavihumibacter fluvii]ULQ51645.1 DUF5606 domain-containing protein [Flavihumibacter fluvii]
MEYNRIIAVTGLPGLFELMSSKTDGAIVRSLDDKTTKFVSSRVHNFSHLESIEIYTRRDNVNLVDIFQAMKKSSEKLPDGKDAAVLKTYFEKVYPDMDFERVYSSDMKKMVKWFEVLKKNDIEFKLSEETEAPVEEVAVAEMAPEEKPAKAAKKKDAPKKDEVAEETSDEKPKKTARKKKTDE